ncbi:hypothetical protein [Clostridium sp.]|uniref:hypothetical protein n=1 Tax=Clostridium sp. TaxID=1506 RepID=UPI00321641F4
MNIPGLSLIAIGIIFLIYSVIYKNEIMINKSDKLIIVNKQKLLTLQLYCSIFNSVCMIIGGSIVIIYNLPNLCVLAYGFIFIFINYIIIPIGKTKQYIKYK